MRCWSAAALALALALGLAAGSSSARAEAVSQEYLGLEVTGNLEIAPGKSLAADGAALIVHGSAGHHGAEVIAALQQGLKQRGVNSLAITLSLGAQKRTGVFDCKLEHDHRHGDASDEIVSWVEWLQHKGAAKVYLVGHSRGAAQAALVMVERADLGVRGLVLAAPLYQTPVEIAARYEAAFGQPLAPLLDAAHRLIEAGDGDTLMAVPGFLHCKPARATAAAFFDYYSPDPQHDVVKLLGEIGAPSVVVVAGDDQLVPALPAALAEAKAARRLGPRVEIVTVPGADHMFRDLFGDDLADKVAELVQQP